MPFDGMGDLEKKVIRCVGCPRDRFTEDALRILRAIRFAAQLGFSIEGETYGAIREIALNLKNVSKERIQVELTKLLTSAHPEKIAMVEDTGISPYVTGDFPLVFQTERERMAGGTSRAGALFLPGSPSAGEIHALGRIPAPYEAGHGAPDPEGP